MEWDKWCLRILWNTFWGLEFLTLAKQDCGFLAYTYPICIHISPSIDPRADVKSIMCRQSSSGICGRQYVTSCWYALAIHTSCRSPLVIPDSSQFSFTGEGFPECGRNILKISHSWVCWCQTLFWFCVSRIHFYSPPQNTFALPRHMIPKWYHLKFVLFDWLQSSLERDMV